MRGAIPILMALGGGLLLFAVGCRTSGGQRTWSVLPPLAPGSDLSAWSENDLQSARSLYLNKCARCHKFYDPANYRAPEWEVWMTKMSRKAKLKPAQEEQLSRYLALFRPIPRASASRPEIN